MVRLILGLIKGAVIGTALGYGAMQTGLGFDGVLGYVVFGLIGFVVGLLVGRPFWSHLADRSSTIWTSILKGIVGFGVGAGLYALGSRVNATIAINGDSRSLTQWTFIFGGLIGAIYGAWVELDDAPAKKAPDASK